MEFCKSLIKNTYNKHLSSLEISGLCKKLNYKQRFEKGWVSVEIYADSIKHRFLH